MIFIVSSVILVSFCAFRILEYLLVYSLKIVCWLHSVGQNHFYVMLLLFTGMLLYPESTLQLYPSRRFCEVLKQVYFNSLSAVRTTWYSVRMLISQQHPSERRDLSVWTPISV